VEPLKPIIISGREVLPLVEGGKGISVSNGESSGAWAASGGVGTFSGVNADSYDAQGNLIPQVYHGRTRRERHEELVAFAVSGGIHQARIAYEQSDGRGRIHMNVLWEMAASERVLHGVLEGAKGLINGVTCGAGMPYKIAEICARYGVHYYPIVSSARAFRALWKRAYHKFQEWLGGVVYEDPWLAGGHNGLSNSEDPTRPEAPHPRVVELRRYMREECGLAQTPIFMAGGVWFLREWVDWLHDADVGPIAFQFGTRPLLTQESPISAEWKRRLLTLHEARCFSTGSARPAFIPPPSTTPSCRNCEIALTDRSPTARRPSASMSGRFLSVPAAARSISRLPTSCGRRIGSRKASPRPCGPRTRPSSSWRLRRPTRF
jgi:NAD(P)H-dependent flavin oxidoreductase YrpB (nitropropane dioxygenase family)